jgi:GntR family transcriptional regulator
MVMLMEFQLDPRSGLATYLQLTQQVKQALRLGTLRPGDQLPTAREVVAKLAINPNTVLKAYRELQREGLVAARPGQGTFVERGLGISQLAAHARLKADLTRWLAAARSAGLEIEDVEALFRAGLRNAYTYTEEVV